MLFMLGQHCLTHQALNSVGMRVRVVPTHKSLPQKAKPYALITLRRALVPPHPITKEAAGLPNINVYVNVRRYCSIGYFFGLALFKCFLVSRMHSRVVTHMHNALDFNKKSAG